MNRQVIFKHYWWIALLVGGVLALLAFRFGGEQRAGLVGGSVAGALGFCYFVQQQKLAETHLFYQLFTSFNQRYDAFNGPLSEMADKGTGITSEQHSLIVDYFNLCAEEFLFYQEGYIPRKVWRSWCRGMAWYLKRHPFKDVWNEEIKTESFYGLTEEAIREGAA
jgi:hypothetical protein